MKIGDIAYSSGFIKQLKKLPQHIIQVAIKKEKIFKANIFHPSLRIHNLKGKLEGLWSLSITESYRIIFEYQTDVDVIFISIGKHDIYKSL